MFAKVHDRNGVRSRFNWRVHVPHRPISHQALFNIHLLIGGGTCDVNFKIIKPNILAPVNAEIHCLPLCCSSKTATFSSENMCLALKTWCITELNKQIENKSYQLYITSFIFKNGLKVPVQHSKS